MIGNYIVSIARFLPDCSYTKTCRPPQTPRPGLRHQRFIIRISTSFPFIRVASGKGSKFIPVYGSADRIYSQNPRLFQIFCTRDVHLTAYGLCLLYKREVSLSCAHPRKTITAYPPQFTLDNYDRKVFIVAPKMAEFFPASRKFFVESCA